MWYNIGIKNTQGSHNCFQCNSPLVLIRKTTEKVEGALFPQTTSVYNCTNVECQLQKDKEKEKRVKQMRDKEVADKMRIQKKLAEKKALEAISAIETNS